MFGVGAIFVSGAGGGDVLKIFKIITPSPKESFSPHKARMNHIHHSKFS